jgi:Sec-independent protein translocase protein TatA
MGRLEEIAVILFLLLIFFKPDKLMDIAKSLGASLHEFKKAINPEGQNPQSAPAQAPPSQPVQAQTPVNRRKRAPAKKKAAR